MDFHITLKNFATISFYILTGAAIVYQIRRRPLRLQPCTDMAVKKHISRKERLKRHAIPAFLHVNFERVIIVSKVDEWHKCYTVLMKDLTTVKLLGLDAEWVTRDRKMRPVSLVQLATLQGTCVLIRLHLLPHIPATLKTLFADKSVIKTGVAVCQDGIKLLKGYGLQLNGCVDLVNLVIRLRLKDVANGNSLQAIAKSFLGVELSKNPNIRFSDWEAPQLTPQQIEYAAKDALVGAFAFWRLISLKIQPTAFVFNPADYTTKREETVKNHLLNNTEGVCNGTHLHDGISSSTKQNYNDQGASSCYIMVSVLCEQTSEHWHKAVSCCQGLFDLDYRGKGNGKESTKSHSEKDMKLKHSKPGNKCIGEVSKAYVARKTPLYHHCSLLAPDGQLLCTCDNKKAQWYIDKGLGVKIQDDPLKVQLTFEPSGRPIDENNYYTQDKLNLCVVCGATDSYIRKSVIPKEYRKFFPQVMKEHRSHDVLLLCLACHQRSNLHDAALKERVAQECEAPLDSGEHGRYKRDHVVHKVKAAAKALLNGAKIPLDRREILENTVKEYFNVESLDDTILKKALDFDPNVCRVEHIPHGQKVFLYYYKLSYNGLHRFERLWRQYFVDTMKPCHLPEGWDVSFNHDNLEKMHQTVLELSNVMVDLVGETLLA